MTAKFSIAKGEKFHLYRDGLEVDQVHLRLETNEYEAGYGRIVVPIPLPIWETIRHFSVASYELIEKTDEELLLMVTTDVDDRIADYEETLRRNPHQATLVGLVNLQIYGSAWIPREEQIERGMGHFRRERRRQREIRDTVATLRASQVNEQPAS